MKKYFLILFVFSFQYSVHGQVLTGISARYNDAYVDWDVFAADSVEDIVGNLVMTWQNPDDWTQWTYRIGEKAGSIKPKWGRAGGNNVTEWDIRGEGKIISASPLFIGDYRQWRVTNNDFSIELRCQDTPFCRKWVVQDEAHGIFIIYLNNDYDFRDWIIEDELDPSVSLPMKMTLVFLAMLNGVPKS